MVLAGEGEEEEGVDPKEEEEDTGDNKSALKK